MIRGILYRYISIDIYFKYVPIYEEMIGGRYVRIYSPTLAAKF